MLQNVSKRRDRAVWADRWSVLDAQKELWKPIVHPIEWLLQLFPRMSLVISVGPPRALARYPWLLGRQMTRKGRKTLPLGWGTSTGLGHSGWGTAPCSMWPPRWNSKGMLNGRAECLGDDAGELRSANLGRLHARWLRARWLRDITCSAVYNVYHRPYHSLQLYQRNLFNPITSTRWT